MKHNRLVFIAAACALAANVASAQESLIDIYQRALQNDPQIRQQEAIYLATAEVKPQARSFLLPGFSASGNLGSRYSENPFGATFPDGSLVGTGSQFESDTHGWSVNLNQTLFDWGRFATLKQADKQVAQAEIDYEAAKQDLLVRVANSYFIVLAAEDTLAAAVAAREAIARQLEQNQRRFEVGLIAITDVQESQAGYDGAVATEIESQRILATARESLREIVGELVTDLATPIEDLPLLNPDPADADAWVRTAMEQNLSLISSRLAADIAEDDITISRSARLPTLSLSAGYTDSFTDQAATIFFSDPLTGNSSSRRSPTQSAPSGYNWTINLQVPLFTGGLNSSRIQQSVYRHRAARESLELVARQTERQTRDAYLGVISEISRVEALRRSVESNETALRAVQAGFEVGTRTTVDVLISQESLRQAQTSYSRARYDYIINVLNLKQAAGTLSVQDLEQVDGWLEQ